MHRFPEVPLRDVLPAEILAEIARQYREAAADAVADFDGQYGDEDALTGALGSVLRDRTNGILTVKGTTYTWRTTSRKLRGRGRGAPERRTGMDAIIELEVWDGDELKARKSLPVQSKKRWRATDPLLRDQAQKIADLPGGGIVVDFEPQTYWAVDARAAAAAHGNRAAVPHDKVKELGEVLSTDFLECTVGSRDVYFDAERELLITIAHGGIQAQPVGVDHRVLTKVTSRS